MDLHTVTGHRPARDRTDLALAPGETPLAGGTWLFSEPQPDVTGLVDLTTLGWPDLEPLPDGGLRIGATCPIATLAERPGLPAVVADCADALLMSFKVQQVATVGGNLCLALPAGAMISLLAGLGAEAVVWTADGGERREPVAAYVRGVQRTSLATGEVLRAVDLGSGELSTPSAFRRAALSPLGRSAAVVVGRRDGDAVVVTVTAATTRPVVITARSAADLDAGLVAVDCWYDDPHGAPDWRAAVTGVLAREVWEELA